LEELKLTVKDYMTKFLQIKQEMLVQDAAALMEKQGTGSALVLKGSKPVGIITERDLLRKVVARGLDPARLKVGEIMSSPLLTISMDEKITAASLLMDKKNIRRLAVTNEKGEIIGKVTAHGIARGVRFQRLKKAFSDRPRQYYAGNIH
jgi:malate dehydrogenase (oxaloacetate-decarboxylating)